jgi:hypothetical protein
MDRFTFFKLMEAGNLREGPGNRVWGGPSIDSKTAERLGKARKFMGKHGRKMAMAAGLGVTAMGARHVMKRRAAGRAAQAAQAASAARSAAEATKPMNRLKAAGRGAISALKGNPRRALAAGAVLTGLTFLRRKDKKRK